MLRLFWAWPEQWVLEICQLWFVSGDFLPTIPKPTSWLLLQNFPRHLDLSRKATGSPRGHVTWVCQPAFPRDMLLCKSYQEMSTSWLTLASLSLTYSSQLHMLIHPFSETSNKCPMDMTLASAVETRLYSDGIANVCWSIQRKVCSDHSLHAHVTLTVHFLGSPY